MKGSCIIDGIDIDSLGMFILKGGDYDFLSFPARVDPEQNNWFEQNGLDVDLSEVFFKEKKLVVRFYLHAETGDQYLKNLNSFYDIVSRPGYRSIYSREFDKTFDLRYVSNPTFKHKGGLYKAGNKKGDIAIEFSMDDPLQIFSGSKHIEPSLFGTLLSMENGDFTTTEDSFLLELEAARRRNPSYVILNGYDLSDFGIIVNQCYDSVLSLPSVKAPLTRSSSRSSGLKAFTPRERTFEAKQINIDCTMFAGSREEFYYNYEALFNNLTVTRELEVRTFAGDMECFYSSMQNFQKLRPFSDRVYIKFTLVLSQITPGLIDFILGTEDSFPVQTESDLHYIEF